LRDFAFSLPEMLTPDDNETLSKHLTTPQCAKQNILSALRRNMIEERKEDDRLTKIINRAAKDHLRDVLKIFDHGILDIDTLVNGQLELRTKRSDTIDTEENVDIPVAIIAKGLVTVLKRQGYDVEWNTYPVTSELKDVTSAAMSAAKHKTPFKYDIVIRIRLHSGLEADAIRKEVDEMKEAELLDKEEEDGANEKAETEKVPSDDDDDDDDDDHASKKTRKRTSATKKPKRKRV